MSAIAKKCVGRYLRLLPALPCWNPAICCRTIVDPVYEKLQDWAIFLHFFATFLAGSILQTNNRLTINVFSFKTIFSFEQIFWLKLVLLFVLTFNLKKLFLGPVSFWTIKVLVTINVYGNINSLFLFVKLTWTRPVLMLFYMSLVALGKFLKLLWLG